MKVIESARHPLVQRAIALRNRARARRAYNQVFVEGGQLVLELAEIMPPIALMASGEAPLRVHCAVAAKRGNLPEIALVRGAAARKLSGLVTSANVFGIFPLPAPKNPQRGERWLICDGVSDPGNLGALIRSAKAFGWDGVFTTSSSCDPFNDKALRAARGACLHIPLATGTIEDVLKSKTAKTRILVANARGREWTTSETGAPFDELWLAVGNESRGACRQLEEVGELIAIRAKGMESLNVACAGAILMHAFQRALVI